MASHCCCGSIISCCPDYAIPDTLYVTWSLSPGSSGSCSCADGAVIAIMNQAGAGLPYRWQGSGTLGSCGATVYITLDISPADCSEQHSASCIGYAAGVLASGSVASCDPFLIEMEYGGPGGVGTDIESQGCNCTFVFGGSDYVVLTVTA